jgi:excisionase family DNA binding protein
MQREYISIEEAAVIAERSAATIRRWIDQGELPAYEISGRMRVKRADVDELMEPQRLEGDDVDDEGEMP